MGLRPEKFLSDSPGKALNVVMSNNKTWNIPCYCKCLLSSLCVCGERIVWCINYLLSHVQAPSTPNTLKMASPKSRSWYKGTSVMAVTSTESALGRPEWISFFQLNSHHGTFLQTMMHKAENRMKISKSLGLVLILRVQGQQSNPAEFILAIDEKIISSSWSKKM